jgi:hypothetical protein
MSGNGRQAYGPGFGYFLKKSYTVEKWVNNFVSALLYYCSKHIQPGFLAFISETLINDQHGKFRHG